MEVKDERRASVAEVRVLKVWGLSQLGSRDFYNLLVFDAFWKEPRLQTISILSVVLKLFDS